MKNKLLDWKNRLKDRHMFTIVMIMVILLIAVIALSIYIYNREKEYRQASENAYNMAFYELINYVEDVEIYLAKSMITSSAEHGAETLSAVHSEANLAAVYLSQLPIETEGLSTAQKFLNQVSDYSYTLSMKTINGEDLSDEDLENLEEIHEYAVQLKEILNELANEINEGTLSWGELAQKGTTAFETQVSTLTSDSFGNIESTFDDYTGLIYDGAFSEHMTSTEKKGLTGDDITEDEAKQIALEFTDVSEDNITSSGISENGNISSYNFSIDESEGTKWIAISKKGGHIVYMSYYRTIEENKISEAEAVEKGKEFLENKGFSNMQETYYMVENGTIVINYAYTQGDVIVYSDLIKLKIALDNGEILGIETAGYLNCHFEREIEKDLISEEDAKSILNERIELSSSRLAIIPTEFNTEILCYEFTGKVGDNDFLVYINAQTGKEEDILMIVNTPNGTLTT